MRARVLVVEDEEPARRLLRRYLEQLGDLELDEAVDGEVALTKLQQAPWDIVLLDIEMPGLDGVSLMHFCASLSPSPAVIFTTAYAEHAVKAFEGGAVDYLLKPFSRERLRQALERALRRRQTAERPATTPRIPIPLHEGHLLLPVTDLLAVRVEDRTLHIETRTGDRLQTRAYTLQGLEAMLPPGAFLRIARDCLVQLDAVREVVPWFSGRYKVVLHTGTVYMCSREYARSLLNALGLSREK
ncbi:MAG: DNA-binding response regulator [Bacteroidia bacterium]|nr:MAG: DNA-binding response regulator [Bacteroidia bacterium]